MHRLVLLPGRRTTRRMLLAAAAAAAVLPAQASAQTPCATQGTTGTAYAQGVNCRTVKLDGHPRRFLVYVPSTAPPVGERRPVVFMFHGSGGDGEKFLRMSGWRQQADATGLIAVFPTGLRYRVLETGLLTSKWNDFSLASQIDTSEEPPGSDPGAPVPADDVSFVDTMVSDLRAQLPIDAHRVYASGFSNGAGFTSRLSVERADRLAAVAYAAGGLPAAQTPPARPVPTFITAGTLDDRIIENVDPTLPELPLDPVGILTQPGLAGFFGFYHSTFGLDPSQYGAIAAPHATTLRWPATGSGPNGAVLKFGMLEDVTHEFPNGTNNPNGFAAAPEYWEFLKNYRAP